MNDEKGSPSEGSGRAVADFSPFCEGDIEPRLNKKIEVLIDSMRNYIIYLDEELYVEWVFSTSATDVPAGFEGVANRVGLLESISLTQLTREQRLPFSRLLGEAMARVVGGSDEEEAKSILEKAEAYLKARGAENARVWFLRGALQIVLAAGAVAALLLLLRLRFVSDAALSTIDVLAGAMFGGLGAMLSVAGRSESIQLEPVAGAGIHRFEGMVRVLVGIAGAFFLALAIKANLVLGMMKDWQHPVLALFAFCLVAGASERLVPGLVRNMENYISRNGKMSRGGAVPNKGRTTEKR